MKFDITQRYAGAVIFSAEIDATEDTHYSIRLGLAVKAAVSARVNLSGSNLRGCDLSGCDLRGSDLRDCDLSGCDLSGSNLSGSNLSGSNLRGCDLRGSDLRDCDLRVCDLSVCDLSGSDLHDCDLSGSNLSGSNLRVCDLSVCDLSGSDLHDCDLSGCDLRGDKINSLFAAAQRMDGYFFFAFALQSGGWKIKAGCRWFTLAEYRAHIEAEYPGTDKARETADILDFLERRAMAAESQAERIAAP